MQVVADAVNIRIEANVQVAAAGLPDRAERGSPEST